MHKTQKTNILLVPCLIAGCALLLFLGGCNEDDSDNPIPTPTPSPTATPLPFPTPTPDPFATPTPTPSTFAARNAGVTVTEQVVDTNAEIISAGAQEALKKVQTLQQSIAALVTIPNADNLTAATTALSTARSAFAEAAIAVFYANPNSADELAALPDSINIMGATGRPQQFDALENLLAQFAAGTITGVPLANSAEELTTSIQTFADAWDAEDTNNFRNQFFLPTPDEAVARILQGLITVTALQNGDTASILTGINNFYVGQYQIPDGDFVSGPGLKALIEEVDPDSAQAIADSIANARQLNSAATQQEVTDALSTINQQLIAAAAAMGITFEETP